MNKYNIMQDSILNVIVIEAKVPSYILQKKAIQKNS